MPAVQLENLDAQIGSLAWKFTRPVEFQQSLAELFTFFGEQVYRPGITIPKNAGIKFYRVPPIVIIKIEHKLTEWSKENPDAAFLLADQIHRDTHFEPRVLAAHTLGILPAEKVEPVIELIKEWAVSENNRIMLDSIFFEASFRLRNEDAERWISLCEEWLICPENREKKLGIRALIPLAGDRGFINLPYIYHLITPLIIHPSITIQNDLIDLLEVLITRAPNEVSYLLQDILQENNEKAVQRLVRKLLPLFSVNIQSRIRQSLS